MELILWRHAEAADGGVDLERPLTTHGRRQANQMAQWLDARLPKDLRILVSPARRAEETVRPLGRPFELVDAVAPGADAADLIKAAGWPDAGTAVLIVGHQPTLGDTASLLLGGREASWRFAKGAVWWLKSRERKGRVETVLLLAIEPEMLR